MDAVGTRWNILLILKIKQKIYYYIKMCSSLKELFLQIIAVTFLYNT